MDVADILTQINNHGFSDIAQIDQVTYINSEYKRVCSLAAWPFMEQQVATTLNTSPIAVPTDWSKTLSFVLYYDVNMSQLAAVLQPYRLDSATKTMTNQTSRGTPNYYWFLGDDSIYLYPFPDRTFYYRLTYTRKPVDITALSTPATDVLLPDRHMDILLHGALMHLFALNDDYDGAAFHKNLRDQRVEEMRADVFEQQYDRPDIIDRVDPDDWGIDW